MLNFHRNFGVRWTQNIIKHMQAFRWEEINFSNYLGHMPMVLASCISASLNHAHGSCVQIEHHGEQVTRGGSVYKGYPLNGLQ